MLSFSSRIAARYVSFLCLGSLLGALPLHAFAQEVSTATMEEYSRAPVPVFHKYVFGALGDGPAISLKAFVLSPAATGTMIGVAVTAILMLVVFLNIRAQHSQPR